MRLHAAAVKQPRLVRGAWTRRRRRALVALGIVVIILACSGIGSALAYSSVKSQADQLQAQLTVHSARGVFINSARPAQAALPSLSLG